MVNEVVRVRDVPWLISKLWLSNEVILNPQMLQWSGSLGHRSNCGCTGQFSGATVCTKETQVSRLGVRSNS